MNIYEHLQGWLEGKGTPSMWRSTKAMTDLLESRLTEEEKAALLKQLYAINIGQGHYNEYFAQEQVAKMWYTDKDGVEHHAPFIGKAKSAEIYEQVKADIPDYNAHDWWVTLEMTHSDNITLLRQWFKDGDPEETNEKIVDLAVNWLKDDDAPQKPGERIWGYFNP